MKKLIAELPTLTAPVEKEELIIYLAAAREAMIAILITEREAKQMLIYFVSRALQGQEINYTPMEKLVLALVHANKRLKRYIQAHPIIVITDQPIKQPRISVKRQILADFIVERPEDDSLAAPMEVEEELPDPWTLFDATNNEVEYEALIAGIRIAEQIRVKTLQTHVDSRLVANQINGSYIAKEPGMIQYLEKVKTLASCFKKFSIKQVPRSENKKADSLSKIMSTGFAHLTNQVLVEELNEKSINEAEVLAIVKEEGNT
ncbi:reverse transcriptase domain-containing protein [Tanacetum coccineum]